MRLTAHVKSSRVKLEAVQRRRMRKGRKSELSPGDSTAQCDCAQQLRRKD